LTFSRLDQLGPAGEMSDRTPFPMRIELRPGGRWFRDHAENVGMGRDDKHQKIKASAERRAASGEGGSLGGGA